MHVLLPLAGRPISLTGLHGTARGRAAHRTAIGHSSAVVSGEEANTGTTATIWSRPLLLCVQATSPVA